jgi:hypothetical protein
MCAALATFLKFGKNFEHTIIEAVNMLGSDTDTIAAMAGSLSGAHGGYSVIPERWAMQMQDFAYFMRAASALSHIAQRKAKGPELQSTYRRVQDAKLPLVDSLAKSSTLASNKRVQHSIFGSGTIRNVEVQPLKRPREASILFIIVLFDSGQTCKFKFSRSRPYREQRGQKTLFD